MSSTTRPTSDKSKLTSTILELSILLILASKISLLKCKAHWSNHATTPKPNPGSSTQSPTKIWEIFVSVVAQGQESWNCYLYKSSWTNLRTVPNPWLTISSAASEHSTSKCSENKGSNPLRIVVPHPIYQAQTIEFLREWEEKRQL